MKKDFCLTTACLATMFFFSCNNSTTVSSANDKKDTAQSYVQKHLKGYATVKLTTDLSQFTDKTRQHRKANFHSLSRRLQGTTSKGFGSFATSIDIGRRPRIKKIFAITLAGFANRSLY